MSVIRAESAVVNRGQTRAVDGVTMSIDAGQWVSVIGRNGSGKSTLLSTIAGLLPITRGSVSCELSIGMVLQRTALDALLTIRENARFFAALHGLPRKQADSRIADLLEASALYDRADDRVGTLSGGLARRADLLRACVVEPEVLVLDEPTAGLDEPSRRAFLDQVRALHRLHKPAILWATHDDAEARAAARVIVMESGRVIADGSPWLLESERSLRRIRLDGEPAVLMTDAQAAAFVQQAIERGDTVTVEPASLLDRFTLGTRPLPLGDAR